MSERKKLPKKVKELTTCFMKLADNERTIDIVEALTISLHYIFKNALEITIDDFSDKVKKALIVMDKEYEKEKKKDE